MNVRIVGGVAMSTPAGFAGDDSGLYPGKDSDGNYVSHGFHTASAKSGGHGYAVLELLG